MDQDSDDYSSQFSHDDNSISPESDHILQDDSPTPILQEMIDYVLEQPQPILTPEPSLQPRPSSAKKSESDVIFNVSGTKYRVVKEIGNNLFQWNLNNEFKSAWDVAWIDVTIDSTAFSRLKPFQKINFFPGIHCIARKDQLSNNLKRLKRRFHESYDFFPETFTLPAEYPELKTYFMKEIRNKKIVIVKPQASCQGKGIYLADNIKNIPENSRCVVQKYLTRPYLLDGLKFDLRIYVLLSSCNPLKIYLFDDGLARFATETYKSPDMNNMSDMFMHLTNYAINKDSPNFVFNTSANDHNVGHKRSIKALFKDLKTRGHDIDTLWREIKKIVIKTFCSVQPVLNQNYKSHLFTKNRTDACFQVFGFDVIIDDNFKPWLLEVNASPSFSTDTPLDKSIKEKVIYDALRIMKISSEDRLNYNPKKKSKNDPPADQEPSSYRNHQKEDTAEADEDYLGGYEKIYPLNDYSEYQEDYDVFVNEAQKFWSLALGISAKKDNHRVIKKPLDAKNITSQAFMKRYENEKLDLALGGLLPPELQSSTERIEIRCRGGKRGEEEVASPPTKVFDLRSPLLSPSGQNFFANQTFNHFSKRNPNDISMESRDEKSYVFPNIQTLLNERETGNSTPVVQIIEYPHSYHQTPRNRDTDVVKLFKPIGRESSRLLNKSPDKLLKESLEHKRSINLLKKKLDIKPATNPIASLSASDSFYKASWENSLDVKRRKLKPRQNDGNFTIVGLSQQSRPVVINDEETERYSLPKRFAQHLIKQKSERDHAEAIQNQTSVNLLPFERSKLRSAQNQRPKSSMRRPEPQQAPICNLITLKEVKYQKAVPKYTNFVMPKMGESISNCFLKKLGFTNSKSKENFKSSKIRVLGTRVGMTPEPTLSAQAKA